MNAWLHEDVWWFQLAILLVALTAVVFSAAILNRWLKSAAWQRTVWQACLATLALMALVELIGVRHELPAWRQRAELIESRVSPSPSPLIQPLAAAPSPHVPPTSPSSPAPSHRDPAQLQTGSPSISLAPVSHRSPQSTSQQAWWLLVWLAGTIALLARGAILNLAFAWWRQDARPVTDRELIQRVDQLRSQLGFRRRVRVIASSRFASPVAFGWLQPTIGLPSRFTSEHEPARQDVMLAHELAHLAAGDPFWRQLANLTTALLWWHPATWYARRQLQVASEIAADEASLIVTDGPGLLAQCLVELGARMTQPQSMVGLGIDGNALRSGLGRRVLRLVGLRERRWSPPGHFATKTVHLAVPTLLAAGLTAGMAWSFPETSNQGATMKHWQQALGLLALSTTLSTAQVAAPATPAEKPIAPEPQAEAVPPPPAPVPPIAPPAAPAAPAAPARRLASVRHAPASPALGKGAEALLDKLERLRLSEVSYDALPLAEVIQDLIRQSARLDPSKEGVNFLFGKERTPPAASVIDPATGLPITAPAMEDFDLRGTTIVIHPPLKNVRLVDVLDAIVKVADQPIKYSIEEYAVVFTRNPAALQPRAQAASSVFAASPAAPAAVAPPPATSPAAPANPVLLQTRTFKLDSKKFFSSVDRMFGVAIDPESKNVGAKLQPVLYSKAGLRSVSPDSVMLYNSLTGILLIRGTPEEIEAVQALIETLGGTATKGAEAKSSTSSSFLKHLAEGPHVHLHRAVTGMFGAVSELAPPPFSRSNP